MNDKQFTCLDNETPQSCTSHYPIIPSGTFSPTTTFNDLCSNLLPQNSTDKCQSKHLEPSYMFPDLPAAWESTRLPEKIDLVELGSKDLSASYLNVDPSVDGQFNKYELVNQWGSNANTYQQKVANFSSCAQVGKFYDRTPNYCNIQKPLEKEAYKSCAYYNNNGYYKQSDEFQSTYGAYQTYYDPKFANHNTNDASINQSFLTYPETLHKTVTNNKELFDFSYLPTLDSQIDASNEESDIVVEDSSSEYSEENDQRHLYEATKCLMCNAQYTPLGMQFYVLTNENPLTMSSQTPVKSKISQFICKNIFSSKNYLCNNCLGLVNAIDHLQLKLDSLVKDLMDKFRISCFENNIAYKDKHIEKGRKYANYKCKKCRSVLDIKTLMRNHLKNHHFQGYLCELCGKTISTYKKLKIHFNNHKKANIPLIKAFICLNKQCKRKFRTKFHLKEHVNYCLGLLPFKCQNSHCNKKFASPTKLKSHMKLKHEKKFIAICSICNIGFVKASDYKSHMTSHSTDKKFSCHKCDKSYKTISNLNFHLKSHEKSLPYICSICHKGFMRKEYHEAHMNNHKGVKNFACPSCDKKFVSQKNLDAHLKYHEGTVKSNICNICKKVVTSCFEEHLKVHSNYKEFECDLCDMKFNTKNSLNKHKKRKHQDVQGR